MDGVSSVSARANVLFNGLNCWIEDMAYFVRCAVLLCRRRCCAKLLEAGNFTAENYLSTEQCLQPLTDTLESRPLGALDHLRRA
jgi:hypothetical protein